MNYKGIALLVVCIAVLAAAGCTSLSGDNLGGTSSSPETVRVVSHDSGYGVAEQKTSWAGAAVPVAAPAAGSSSLANNGITTDTKIIKTADMTLEVRDIPGTVESLKALAVAQGGFLSSTNIRKNYNNQLTGTVILRVPKAAFDTTLSGAKALGTVKSISTSGEDVTEEYVDLEAQKTSYTNQLAQYNAIMKQSTRVEDIIKVQEQIDRVQTQLDRLNGRLNYLDNRIDISTITVYLEEPEPVGGQSGHDFVATINNGISGFLGMIDALIILAFTLLPLIVIGGIGYWVYQRYKNKKGAGPHPVIPEEKK